ncbi:MAG: fibronectin type III domain-containing protein, partial [Ilumatobacteraceae bacterium]
WTGNRPMATIVTTAVSTTQVAKTVKTAATEGWTWWTDGAATTEIPPVFSLDAPPATTQAGSASFGPFPVNDARYVATGDYDGTRLSSLTALSYTTNSSSSIYAPQLALEVKLTPGATTWQGRLVFIPSGDTSGWKTWNTMDSAQGKWYASSAAAGTNCRATLCTWNDVLTYWPSIEIDNPDTAQPPGTKGRLGVRGGETSVDRSALTLSFDTVVVGAVVNGANKVTTFDFEPTRPSAPTAVTAVAGDGQATISWTAPAAGDSPITGYTVTGAPSGACTVVAPVTSCLISGLTNGTTYSFTVTATSSTGTGPASAPIAAVVPFTVPAAPIAPTATAGANSVTISWTAPANNGRPITGYTVTGVPGGSCTTATTSCTIAGLTAGTSYTFRVFATNAAGDGPASAASTAVTVLGPVVAPSVLDYNPVGPKRVFDTRPGQSLDALRSVSKTKIGGAYELQVQMTDLAGLVPATGVGAVSLNVTITNPDNNGFVTVYSCGTRELVSSVNFVKGQTVANAVIAPLSETGTVCFYSNTTVDVVTDVNGWFAAGRAFTSVGPKRVFDTRPDESPESLRTVAKAPIVGGNFIEVKMSDLAGFVPATGVGSVSLNVTVTNPAASGFITVYSCGTREFVSSVNYTAGNTVANAVIAPLSAAGTVCFFSTATTDLIVDINGWLKAGSGFTGVSPKRVLDTRAGQSLDALRSVAKKQIGGGYVLEVQVTNLAGVTPATGVGAVSLNVTATGSADAGFITVYACGTREFVSSVNYTAGGTVANAVLSPVSATGTVCLFSNTPVDVVVDINGWFSNMPTP